MPNAIEARALTKLYDGRLAVDRVDWELPAGSVCALLGPNAAGKTTLLRMLLGFTHPTQGSCRILDADPWEMTPELRARVTYVSEEPILPGWLSVRSLLAFHASLYPRWNEGSAADLVRRFELDPAQKVGTLSKGQHRRLMVCLAIAARPALLVLDEPGSGLDVQGRRLMLQVLADYLAESGASVLVSTHLVTDVERIASHVAVLSAGRLRAFGELDELREQVKTVRLSRAVFERSRRHWEQAGLLSRSQAGEHEVLVVRCLLDQPLAALRQISGKDAEVIHGERQDTYLASSGEEIQVLHMSLEDIYLALAGAPSGEAAT